MLASKKGDYRDSSDSGWVGGGGIPFGCVEPRTFLRLYFCLKNINAPVAVSSPFSGSYRQR